MVNEIELRTIVSDVLNRRFADEGLLRSDIDTVEDFDGEPIVRVTAHFSKAASALALFAASDEMRDRLKNAGDGRFVFIKQDVRGDAEDELQEETRSRRSNQ